MQVTGLGTTDCGVVLIDKAAGVTSHDVVIEVREKLSEAAGSAVKVGHSGTLDPFATGLLVVMVGRATRLQRYLQHQPKSYRAVAKLGWSSTSGDSDGELTHTGRVPSDPQLAVGDLELPVPALSAIRIEGERLYSKVHRGEQFEPPVRSMTVYRAERMQLDGDTATFEIDCAGGTYIRSVIASLDDAYCLSLERTRVGDLDLSEADPDRILDPLDALSHLERLDLSEPEAEMVVHGRALPTDLADESAVRLAFGDRLVGVGRVRDGWLKSETNLATSLEEVRRR